MSESNAEKRPTLCGIKHGFGDQTCIREQGHDGLCRCKAERGAGTITYSEWQSKDGEFHSHHAYHTIYPKNAEGRP
jgi:hypothetical protein